MCRKISRGFFFFRTLFIKYYIIITAYMKDKAARLEQLLVSSLLFSCNVFETDWVKALIWQTKL